MAKDKLSKADIKRLIDDINFVTVLNSMRFGNQFVDIERDDNGEIATPPSLKSLKSHVMTDIGTEMKDAEKMAKYHNECDPEDDMGAGVTIKAVDNHSVWIKNVASETETPINVALEYSGKSVTISGGSGRNMGAVIAGVRLATEWFMDEGEIDSDLDRSIWGDQLPDGRAFVMEDMEGKEPDPDAPNMVPFGLAFGEVRDQSYFIDGFNATKELFGQAMMSQSGK